ncbi:hypothetical protein AGMMS49928_05480 [Spirochaetia bacterium]|nr:hypothetical protein AGMMS49928_05480 [Spirochaetia bacterium]
MSNSENEKRFSDLINQQNNQELIIQTFREIFFDCDPASKATFYCLKKAEVEKNEEKKQILNNIYEYCSRKNYIEELAKNEFQRFSNSAKKFEKATEEYKNKVKNIFNEI